MRWLSAGWLGLLGLLIPLTLLYVLKARRVRQRVASTWLWVEVQRELAARSPFKRLVPQLPLFLQLLALTAFALAAARPATSGKATSGEHVAILIDTSASMAAVDGGKVRLDEAKRVAHDIVSALGPGSDAMILDAGREPRLVMAPDRDRRRMHAALDELTVREVEGDLAASLALAVQRLAQGGGSRRIYVVTDGALARPVSLRAAVPVEVIRVGAPMDNAAIVRVDVRAAEDPVLHREQVQAFLLVENHGIAAREVFVTMKQRGASDTLASRRVVLAPGERSPIVLTFFPAPGDSGSGLVFELSPHDALAVDDVAFASIPPGRKLPVILAATEEPSPWLLRVLASDPDAEVTAGPLARVFASVPEDALVVVENACPATVPGGDVWIVNPPSGECFGAKVGALVDRPRLTSWDELDPRLKFLSLDDVLVSQARVLEPASARQVLVRSSLGAIACDASTEAREVTLLGFDVADSDWPYKASFVVFARNLLELARIHRADPVAGGGTAGELLRVHVPLAVTAAEVVSPGAEGQAPSIVSVRSGIAVIPEAVRAGFYRVAWTQPSAGSVLVPVNLTSASESDLRRSLDATSGAASVADAPAATAAPRDHAFWVALVALAFVIVDVWWFTRGRSSVKQKPNTVVELRS